MDKIVPAFETSLFDSTLSDACADFVEAGIDSLLDDGILKSIPIVGALIGVGKTAQNIHDRNLLRQTLRFINSFNSGTLNHDKLEEYKKRISENPRKAEEELGRVLIVLNSNIEIKKSDIIGKLFKSYVNDDIDWEQFCEMTEVTNRLFVTDIGLLIRINRGEVKDTRHCMSYQAERLNSLGLVEMVIQEVFFSSGGNNKTEKVIKISDLGRRYLTHGIEY